MKSKTNSKTRVICMGDSITAGFGIDENVDAPYPAQLQRLLGDKYRVVNLGVSCSCTVNRKPNGVVVGQPYVREREYQIGLKLRGEIYVVMLGVNDAQDGYDDSLGIIDPNNNVFAYKRFFKEDYMRIMCNIKECNPDSTLFMVRPTPVSEKCIWNKHQQEYLNEILVILDEIAQENPDLYVIDVQRAFNLLNIDERQKLYQEDGLHPNEKGATLIAQTVAACISSKMESIK